MQENDQDTSVANEEVVETEAEPEAETTETTDEPSAAELASRLKRAEAKIERMKLDAKVEKKVEKIVEKQTGELSETQLDYLDLKGISDADDIDVVQKVMQRTGQTVRQALQDDYVIQKLAAHKAKRDVQAATPGTTKRAGGQVGDVASAAAKFKETGILPDDRELADAVVDSIAKTGNDRLPPWQR